MAEDDKPYRVYRGGRVKGKVPAPPGPPRRPREEPARGTQPSGAARRLRRVPWGRLILGLILLFVIWAIAWGLAGYFSFRDGVAKANGRLDRATRAALAPQGGSLTGTPSTILVLGTDHSSLAARQGDEHTDSIMLVRTDPAHHRIAFLSIPRDLWVPIPGHGSMKINAAYQIGGAPLAIETVHDLTGLPINHVVIVDFGSFKDLIDNLGGVTIDVPRPIRSNRFDCPYPTQARCDQWPGWRFAKGRQHMGGERALIYSRIRENALDPAENDLTRAGRQQQILQALASQLASVGTFLRLPFVGRSLLEPLATDLSASQLLELGWVKFRAPIGQTLHCRLGGDITDVGGQSAIQPTEYDRNVLAMVLGQSAPQPPSTSTSSTAPGCVVGGRAIGLQ